jgi:hypothetical protein
LRLYLQAVRFCGGSLLKGNKQKWLKKEQPRRHIMRMNNILILYLVVIVCLISDSFSQQTKQETPTGTNDYNYLLYVRNDVNDIFVVSNSLVFVEKKNDGYESKSVFIMRPSALIQLELLTVVRGKFYNISQNNLNEIDLRTGQRRLIAEDVGPHQYLPSTSRLYCLRKGKLEVFDFKKGAYKEIMNYPFLANRYYEILFKDRINIAVSPDERRMAFTEPNQLTFIDNNDVANLPGVEPAPSGLLGGYKYMLDTRLVVSDLQTGTLTRLPTLFCSAFPKGGSLFSRPPLITWSDANTVLILRGDRAFQGRPTRGIAAVNVNTGRMWDIAAIPGYSYPYPSFNISGSDNNIRLYLTSNRINISYKIDVSGTGLSEDNNIGNNIYMGYSDNTPTLFHDKELVEDSQNFTLVNSSPDGRLIAWSYANPNGTNNDIKILDTTRMKVFTIKDRSVKGNFLWVSEQDMRSGEPPAQEEQWEPFKLTLWPSPPLRQ